MKKLHRATSTRSLDPANFRSPANLVSELINRWLRWYLDNRRRDWRLSAFDNYFFGDGTFFVC